MLTHPKISLIIPHTVPLSSPYHHQAFLCKSLKFPSHLHLDSILEDQPAQFTLKAKEQRNLTKIFRSLKCIKKIHQNDNVFHKIGLLTPKIRYLVKKAQRVEVLDFQDKLTSIKASPARLDLWLKYGKSLKSVNYQFSGQMFGPQISHPLFERQIEQSLKSLPKHCKLRTLKFRLPRSSPKTVESLFEFQRYPSSLTTFAIHQQGATEPQVSNHDLVVSAFSRLKSLESLTLSGSNLLLKMVEVLLEKVPSLSNIKKLNIEPDENSTFAPPLNLNQCQLFQKLQHLKIGNIVEGQGLSKLVSPPPPQLESLDITGTVSLSGLESISQFLSLLNTSLKSLKIDIQHPDRAETKQKIRTLFHKISELERLASFKFKINRNTRSYSFQKTYLPPDILENLKGLFFKPVKLKSFEWDVPEISGPGILLDLLKLLDGSCLTLKKLKIFHPFVDLEEYQEAWLFNFLRRLERVEVFYLTGLNIKEKGFWMNLADSFLEMKFLRSLEFGIVTSGLKEEWFLKPLGKILQKRGLEVLKIESSFRAGLGRVKEPLDLKEIMKANPALREISDNIRQVLNVAGLK